VLFHNGSGGHRRAEWSSTRRKLDGWSLGRIEPVETIEIIRIIKIIAIMNDFNQCKPEILLSWVFILACGILLFKISFTIGTPARACASARAYPRVRGDGGTGAVGHCWGGRRGGGEGVCV